MDPWGNLTDGDCVTAEEAFAKAAAVPQLFFDAPTVISWAAKHGFLDGAELPEVMGAMEKSGFSEAGVAGGADAGDGGYFSVDWTNPATLANAIYTTGPVKIGIASETLEDYIPGDPPPSGWCVYGYPSGGEADHCTSLCGFADSLTDMVAAFAARGVAVIPPSDMPSGPCYAMFTWGSIGIVDAASMLAMTSEAWLRNPVTKVIAPAPPAPPHHPPPPPHRH